MNSRWLSILSASCSLLPGSLCAQPDPDDPVRLGFAVGGFSDEIVIDGEADPVWELAPAHTLDNWLPISSTQNAPASTLSGWWKALYDEDNLYVLVEVQDKDLVASIDNKIGNADSVELFLSGTYTRTLAPSWDVSAFRRNDYHLRFGIGPALGEDPRIEVGLHSTDAWTPEPDSADTGEVSYWVTSTEDGYRMEIRIDLELLWNPATPDFPPENVAQHFHIDENNFSDFRKIGFEVQVTDASSTSLERSGKLVWANHLDNYPGDPVNGSSNAWAHPATWGTLIFVEPPSEPMPQWPFMDYYDSPVFHWIYYFDDGWALWYADFQGLDWGLIYLAEVDINHSGWVFHLDHGWIYFLQGSVTDGVFAYSSDFGWITAFEAFGASFYRYDTEEFIPWVPSE